MESLRRDFFNGVQGNEKKISWVKWTKVLSAKKFGGLGVSSFFALNRALLFKWAWRFISDGNSLWYRVISAIHGPNLQVSYLSAPSISWCASHSEIQNFKKQWSCVFSPLFALDEDKDCNVASKFHGPVELSIRRAIRGGVESSQFSQLREMLDTVILSNMEDRWRWDLNGSGLFRVCDVRNYLDDFFLPKDDRETTVPSSDCPICTSDDEDASHLLFRCSMAADIHRLICRWWGLNWANIGSYAEWLSWFKDIRLGSNNRDAVGKAGISALVKCTSAIRQLAYAAVPDSLDEYLQIGEKTSRDCLMHFCNGLRTKILEAQSEASKDLKAPTEWLRGLERYFEQRDDLKFTSLIVSGFHQLVV
ncbi:hypothetical protein Tco_0699232 [Tanacetum coccineum]